MADNKLLLQLSQNLLEILDDEEYYDVIIEVGNDPYKNDGTLSQIKLPNILPEIFQTILRYIYGGKISLIEYDTLDIIKILNAANELSLQGLISYLQSFLIENRMDWMEQNFNLVYQTSYENNSFLELQKFCTELISKQPEKIFNSLDFTSISEKALISLIQLDNLQMNDVQIWDHVLKWGIAQNPELSSDPSNYSNDDFNALKSSLQQCFPFIKFTEFSSREFLNKVYPYKKIIPEDLYEYLIKYFLDHDYELKKKSVPQLIKREVKAESIDSKIITIQHAELISKWIDRLEITDELKNSYEFKLILRGSRDGFTAEKFHEICDNKSRTISIIKVKDSDEILGGYNPIIWESREYCPFTEREYSETNDSFIFSFNNEKDINNHILSRVKNEKYAIDNDFDCGPSFGQGDLMLCGDSFNDCVSVISSYETQISEIEDFSIEEYEVFHIIQNK
ncbi:carbohydrate-binding module family 13 protein [Rhizophagus clarus]|uniref:Carbohydrate-binding module family 13 protein n=1 Tax=Rhizophagus clarus TaxID=94130 RepID=A0A8H3QP28_9GLOM|nr:carbohydrate-binding module family 13 protein [Rhizophagus clarus]